MDALKKYKLVCTQQQATTEFVQASLHPQGSLKKRDKPGSSTGLLSGLKRGSGALVVEESEFAKFCKVRATTLPYPLHLPHPLLTQFIKKKTKKEAEHNPECRQMDVSSFLIKMFQRVTKYPLLVRVSK